MTDFLNAIMKNYSEKGKRLPNEVCFSESDDGFFGSAFLRIYHPENSYGSSCNYDKLEINVNGNNIHFPVEMLDKLIKSLQNYREILR